MDAYTAAVSPPTITNGTTDVTAMRMYIARSYDPDDSLSKVQSYPIRAMDSGMRYAMGSEPSVNRRYENRTIPAQNNTPQWMSDISRRLQSDMAADINTAAESTTAATVTI